MVPNWTTRNERLIDREKYIYDWIETFEENSLFYDVGACLGHFGAFAAYRGHRVVFFEAGYQNARNICEQLNHDEFRDWTVQLERKPVWSSATQVGWVDDQPETGGHRKFVKMDCYIGDPRNVHLNNEANPEVTRPSTCLKDWPSADYIKIDVDGGEQEVIKGMDAESWTKVKGLCIEIHKNFPISIPQFKVVDEREVESGLLNVFYKRLER